MEKDEELTERTNSIDGCENKRNLERKFGDDVDDEKVNSAI